MHSGFNSKEKIKFIRSVLKKKKKIFIILFTFIYYLKVIFK